MRARARGRAGPPPGTDGERIAHGVDADPAAQLPGGGDEPVAGVLVGVGEGEARHAGVGVGAVGGEG